MKVVEKLLKSELIGQSTVAKSLMGKAVFEGKIIDETKNTFVLKTKKGRKRLVKTAYVFEFKTAKHIITIEGRHFAKRPHERIKKTKI